MYCVNEDISNICILIISFKHILQIFKNAYRNSSRTANINKDNLDYLYNNINLNRLYK